ncbi:hypothetical protein LAZ67_17000504 [Cordylochernes scorpioides]|uniref:Transposase n=1 Tax=Cordylochernes scorpioides TaxID=51811 RepID=A0ABY6LHI8_9ARAC|nr:hypothetical protein LAZ67_17000504 [Cordylochernes scorpioides]
MLDSVRDDPNLLQRVITGDEAWVYGYDAETKAQSSQWKLPHEPRPKKARQVRSNVKVLLTVFFDCRGVVHHEFLPQGRTVNKEYYLQVMRNLREAIRQKRPDLWKNDTITPLLTHHCLNVGATRVTSARVDRRILRQAVAAPQATCTAILQHVQDTLDHSISTRTISRRLVANGLHSCRPLRRLPLTPPNRRQRLEWCRARSTWMTEWHRVVFSDESRFCLSSDSRRVRVWRRRGERSNPAAIVERPTVRQRGIMVWGAIAYDSRSPLLRIQGTMTAQRYVDDVLRPVTLPYLQGVPNALYQQDNARPHTARISQQALQDVQMLPWPPYSPDLSPIEHVWDIIGRRLHALPQPRSEDELWQMVEREWRAIPQDAIRTLIDSLPRRVAACIAVRGGPTCY